jgi:hypothetical protein
MATINGITISRNNTVIAQAAAGEIAPPDNLGAVLTINDATWNVGARDVLNYLQQTCSVSATAAGKQFNNDYKILSIGNGNRRIKLGPT